jgi:dipeptidyl aminopeptidase/acylaminoacyl peptidase
MRMSAVVACGMWAAMGWGVVAGAQDAAAKRPMTFADLAAMKRVSDPQVSPSGQWVLFSVTDVVLEKNTKTNHLWVVPLGGIREQGSGIREKQVTFGVGESNGRFSPDGKRVMYSSAEGEGQLWLADWDEAKGTLSGDQMLPSIPAGADGAVWAPDSNHFLFVANVYPECESKAADGAKRVHEEAICNFQHAQAEKKSPVKAQIFDSLLYRHWDHYEGKTRSHVFWTSVERALSAGDPHGLEPKDLTPMSVVGDHEAPTFSLGGPLGYAVAPGGREVAYVVNLDKVPAESTNNDVFVLDPEGDVHAAKKVSMSPGSDDGPAYSPDGKWLAWRSQARNGYESDKFDLVVMDRGSGKIKNLTTKFDNWVDEFTWAQQGEIKLTSGGRFRYGDTIIFAGPYHGAEALYRVSADVDDHIQRLTDRGEFSGTSVSPSGANAVAAGMTVDKPSEIYVVDLTTISVTSDGAWPEGSTEEANAGFSGEFRERGQLTHVDDGLVSQLSLSPMEPFWFTGAAGTKVEGFIVKPPNFDPSKKYPVKFIMHGGPQTQWGDAWSYRWNPELFAASGYVVVMVNRRGSTGYGQRFLEEVSGDWGGKAFVDLMKGMDAAEVKYPFIDKNRECALGASYGGFMANWVLTHTDRFKCIVSHDGMYDPISAFGATEELWFNEWEFRPLKAGIREQGLGIRKGGDSGVGLVEQSGPAVPWDYWGKPVAENPFLKNAPMGYIKNAHTPTLVVHGQKDYRLDVSQGFELFTALQLLGVPSKMLYFPDEGHWVLKPQNSQLWYETVEDWCDRWTGTGKYAGVGPEVNPMAKKQGAGKRE